MSQNYTSNFINRRFPPFFRWLVLAVVAAAIIYSILEYLFL
jgi:hypothetical protein